MAYEPQGLDAALAAAVGDDPVLVGELRRAFADSAIAITADLRAATDVAGWRSAALRLQGLAASFGALALMTAASAAADGPAHDRAMLRRIARLVEAIDAAV